MNKDMTVLFENSDYTVLTWDKYDGAKYVLMGLNDCFNYEKIVETNNNGAKIFKNLFKKYINIKVYYTLHSKERDEDIVIGSSNPYVPKKVNYNKLDLKFLKSFNGITLSIQSKDIYDKYYIYEKVGNNYLFMMESEDFQVTSKNKGKNLISIIVPIYNSEKFLSRCVDSILVSNFKDMEVLLIDDGSKDKSPEIADWYSKEYGDFIKTIHKENEGVSYTRNKGIELATSDYIAFVDNDDIVHPYMHYNLYKAAIAYDLDIAIGKTIIRNKPYDYSICLSLNNDECLIYDYDKMFYEKNHVTFDNIYFVAVWNKIIKSSIVKDHPFPLFNHYEDTYFTRNIYSYLDKFGFVSDAYYVWDKRIQGTVGTATNSYKSKDDDRLRLHREFRDATFYCVENGNKDRIDNLVYDSIKEAYDFMKTNDLLDKHPDICGVYNEAIYNYGKKYNVLKNKYLKENKEVFNYTKKVLSLKTEL